MVWKIFLNRVRKIKWNLNIMCLTYYINDFKLSSKSLFNRRNLSADCLQIRNSFSIHDILRDFWLFSSISVCQTEDIICYHPSIHTSISRNWFSNSHHLLLIMTINIELVLRFTHCLSLLLRSHHIFHFLWFFP